MKHFTRFICLMAALTFIVPFAACSGNQNVTKVIVEYDSYPGAALIDYSGYTALKNIDRLFGKGFYAFALDSKCIYKDGSYDTVGGPVLRSADDGQTVTANADLLGQVLGQSLGNAGEEPEALAEKTGMGYVFYDGKLLILFPKEKAGTFDLFSDLYTVEALYVRLMETDKDNLDNLLIDLPGMVSNGSTNYNYYTAPDLDLGLQTSVYYSQMGDINVAAGPMIVAGQGKNEFNNTLVRIFNRQQACITQFLAFPSEVKGGVQVQAVQSGGAFLTACAAFKAEKNSSKAVRVFDTDGMLRASFKPEDIAAPYVICAGRFAEGSSDDYIAVTSMYQTGTEGTLLIYKTDGTLYKKLVLSYSTEVPGKEIQLSCRKGTASEELLMYFTDSDNLAFAIDPVSGSVSRLEIKMPSNATGVYGSAFDELAVTVKDGTFSYITAYSSLSGEGVLKNVGWRENRFYSTFAAGDSDDSYVNKFAYNHIRTDLGFKLANKIAMPKLTDESLKNYNYEDWSFDLSKVFRTKYHDSYNIFEPCFTHRWNSINLTKILVEKTDADGNVLFGSVGRDNKSTNYLEGASSFYVGSYADGLLPMAKMRIYPLRHFLQDLSVEFRGVMAEPERLVSVVPVHEQEIDVAGSVGDYNVKMIRGFRDYLIGLYGSLENINKRFGTDFKTLDDFDAPRFDPQQDDPSLCRGKWDTYGASDFFTQWSLYTRYMVNKRIMEAYREALLAGFPPEAINAHSIPEGDAVSGFLGEADTRLSPVEGVTVAGTAYGATRYGTWYSDDNNFINLAYLAGHGNITLGEYCALSASSTTCYAQLKYMTLHGVKAVSVLTDNKAYEKAEREAAAKLKDKNQPRTAETGITTSVVPVEFAGSKYDIVQMSRINEDGSVNNGLLKSVDADGFWEGTVYLCPFHSYVDVKDISVTGSVSDGFKSGKISDLQYGDQAELTFLASYSGKGSARITVEVYNGGYKLTDATAVYELSNVKTPMRYVLSNEITPENITFSIKIDADSPSSVVFENVSLTAQYENIAHKYFGDFDAAASVGGVTFDVFG